MDQPLDVVQLSSILIMTLLGLIVSTSVFAWEVLGFKAKKKIEVVRWAKAGMTSWGIEHKLY